MDLWQIGLAAAQILDDLSFITA